MGLTLIRAISQCLLFDIKLLEKSRRKRKEKRDLKNEKLHFILTHLQDEIANDTPRTQARILCTAMKQIFLDLLDHGFAMSHRNRK